MHHDHVHTLLPRAHSTTVRAFYCQQVSFKTHVRCRVWKSSGIMYQARSVCGLASFRMFFVRIYGYQCVCLSVHMQCGTERYADARQIFIHARTFYKQIRTHKHFYTNEHINISIHIRAHKHLQTNTRAQTFFPYKYARTNISMHTNFFVHIRPCCCNFRWAQTKCCHVKIKAKKNTICMYNLYVRDQ